MPTDYEPEINMFVATIKWVRHTARMVEMKNTYEILVGKPEGKRPLRRPRKRREDNIKMDLTETGWEIVPLSSTW